MLGAAFDLAVPERTDEAVVPTDRRFARWAVSIGEGGFDPYTEPDSSVTDESVRSGGGKAVAL